MYHEPPCILAPISTHTPFSTLHRAGAQPLSGEREYGQFHCTLWPASLEYACVIKRKKASDEHGKSGFLRYDQTAFPLKA